METNTIICAACQTKELADLDYQLLLLRGNAGGLFAAEFCKECYILIKEKLTGRFYAYDANEVEKFLGTKIRGTNEY
jgi:hypothetical protein